MVALYETRGVLAGAYESGRSHRSQLTHTVRLVTGEPLCSRVKAENIVDHFAYGANELQERPTCPVCLARDPRFQVEAR